MCVSANVDDAKLAKILQIFNDLTYDPELWMAAQYGIKGEDWQWEGEEYISKVTQNVYFPRFFRTNIASKYGGAYTLPTRLDPIIADYILQNGERLAIYPFYSKGNLNLDNDDWAIVYEYWVERREIQDLYLAEVAAGYKNTSDTWDDYIVELRTFGLDEANEVLNK